MSQVSIDFCIFVSFVGKVLSFRSFKQCGFYKYLFKCSFHSLLWWSWLSTSSYLLSLKEFFISLLPFHLTGLLNIYRHFSPVIRCFILSYFQYALWVSSSPSIVSLLFILENPFLVRNKRILFVPIFFNPFLLLTSSVYRIIFLYIPINLSTSLFFIGKEIFQHSLPWRRTDITK